MSTHDKQFIIPGIDAKLRQLYKDHKGLLSYQGYGTLYNNTPEKIADNKRKLLQRQDTIYILMRWLQYHEIRKAKGFAKDYGSYTMKHYAEKTVGFRYISNGQFIAAALMFGYEIKTEKGDNSINVLFKMSQQDLNKLERPDLDGKHNVRNLTREQRDKRRDLAQEKFHGWLTFAARHDPDLELALKTYLDQNLNGKQFEIPKVPALAMPETGERYF